MPLIQHCETSDAFRAPETNLNSLLKIDSSAKREDVATKVVLACLEETQNARLGWGFSIKKFAATWASYLSMLGAPFVIIFGGAANYTSSILAFFNLKNLGLLSAAGLTISGADYGIKRATGVSPTSAFTIAILRGYEKGACILSKLVESSYTNQEKQTEKGIEKRQEVIQKKLEETYSAIGVEIVSKYKEGSLTNNDIETLNAKLPVIRTLLSQLDLSPSAVERILTPISTALDSISLSAKKAS